MGNLVAKEYKTFEGIKHIGSDGQEFWLARELAPVLEYSQWRNFQRVVDKAMLACKNSGFNVDDQFADVSKLIEHGKGGKRKVVDYQLSRYACYLIVQNGDPRKEVIALGQTYFANLFRISQADEKIRKEKIMGADNASYAHHEVGQIVREAIIKSGGTLPEQQPTPTHSISEIEKQQIRALKGKKKMLDE